MGKTAEVEMTPKRKMFQTPPCLNLFLDVEATENGIDFDPLPEEHAPSLGIARNDGNKESRAQRRPIRRRRVGNVIREMLAVR